MEETTRNLEVPPHGAQADLRHLPRHAVFQLGVFMAGGVLHLAVACCVAVPARVCNVTGLVSYVFCLVPFSWCIPPSPCVRVCPRCRTRSGVADVLSVCPATTSENLYDRAARSPQTTPAPLSRSRPEQVLHELLSSRPGVIPSISNTCDMPLIF